MTYRFYRTARLGDGSRANPFRSALTRYIPGSIQGATFWDWIHDARPLRYALALTDSVTHVLAASDADIQALSPELADLAAVNTWLESSTLSDPAHTTLEGDGISTQWIAAQTTRRQLFRYAARLHVVVQDVKRLKNAETMDIFGRGLDLQMNQVPVTTRQKIRTWMEAKGLDTTWITNATTVRQVLHYIVQNVDWPVLPFGPVTF